MVIHYTGMASCQAANDRLCDPMAEVSAHYLVSEAGEILALVPEDKRAWHAGAGSWRGKDDINSQSIGVELANSGAAPFPNRQIQALETLLRDLMQRWAIGPDGVIAHSDMAPGRKADPGARFDWRRLALAGLSVWPEATAPGEPANFCTDARRFGYPDVDAGLMLAAFRLRFRPWAKGRLDAVDAGLMANLAYRFGVDGAAHSA